jgi:hypothetical protein
MQRWSVHLEEEYAMTETTATCGRCSRTIEDTPIGVSVDGGPLHSADPLLRICAECAASLARWLERGRRRAATPRWMVKETKDADDQPRHRKHRSPGNLAHEWGGEASPMSGPLGLAAGLFEHGLEVRLRGLQSIMVRLSFRDKPIR